jgi:RNA polymerase sigma-70 factor (ECF subfamily)
VTSAAFDVEEIRDEELVRRILAGDTCQFELLVTRYTSKIYGLAMRLMRNPSDAKDAVQDTFLLVYTKLNGFRSECAFGTWLYRVALNCIYMKLRQRKHAAEDDIEDYLPKFDGQGQCEGWCERSVTILSGKPFVNRPLLLSPRSDLTGDFLRLSGRPGRTRYR